MLLREMLLLKRGLSAWHLIMMALGNVIGGSFFLGSSVAIHAAGPSVILAFVFGGILVYFILFALSEMTVANPDAGSFQTFASQNLGEKSGFVVGWVYWTGMILSLSSEATAVTILLRQWIPNISISLFGSLIIIGVTFINLLGADKISKLASGLVVIKLFAIILFIIIAIFLIFGVFPGQTAVGIGNMASEPLMPGGFMGLAGSMLIVIFTYAGFEIIGFAAPEAKNPRATIPRAIRYTVLSLVGLYILTFAVILPLIPTSLISENKSPMVAALNHHGIAWAGVAINLVLISAILSAMMAAMFGLGRMIRSLCDDGLAFNWLKDKSAVPYKGILFSGLSALLGLGLALFLPRVYLFLISAGGFSILYTYLVIMATHIKFRKKHGCPPEGKCQLWGFPYTSLFVLISLLLAMISMPFISGQASGLVMGLIIVAFYTISYRIMKFYKNRRSRKNYYKKREIFNTEFAKEEGEGKDKK